MTNAESKIREILAKADIQVNGSRPWDIQVHNKNFYNRLLSGGSLAAGESYMDGWWDVEDLSEYTNRLFRDLDMLRFLGTGIVLQILKSKLLNLQTSRRAFQVGKEHYDIGNDLFERMLDKRMIYSCGYWKNATNLDEAQERKLELICQKIGLKKGDKILDIGCGWGGLAQYAAEKYGASVVGITISKEQEILARNRTRGLPVEIRMQDWRDLKGETYSHVVSVGMFEHVGQKNYREFMEIVKGILSPDGLFLLHTVGHSKTTRNLEPWFNKYIFPNGQVPSAERISRSIDRRWFGNSIFQMEDWHNFGADYDLTLSAWYRNFDEHWMEISDTYDDRFYRMWKYYLLVSAGLFRARYLHLWQIVLSPKGVQGGYQSVR